MTWQLQMQESSLRITYHADLFHHAFQHAKELIATKKHKGHKRNFLVTIPLCALCIATRSFPRGSPLCGCLRHLIRRLPRRTYFCG